MSTELNNFERIMAEKLSHYEEVPPAHIWTNIQKSKRKGLLFQHWKLAASVLLILISVTGTLWYLNQKDSVGGVTTHKNLNASQSANETMKDPSFDERNAKSNLNTASAEQETGSMTHIKPIKPSGLHSKHAFKQKIKTSEPVKKDEPLEDYLQNSFERLNMMSRNQTKLSYIIYPSLMQFVYTSKRLGKKYYASIPDDKSQFHTSKWSIEAGGGPNYAFRTLSGPGSEIRNESEKATFGLTTIAKVNYMINPRWSVQTGLTLENRNEKIKYNTTVNEEILTQTSRQVTILHPVLPAKTITVIDSSYSNQNKDYNFSSVNKYQSLNLPVVIGYNFSLGKLKYRASAGALFNILSMNTAYTLNHKDNVPELLAYSESKKINTSLYSAMAILYPLNEHCEGLLELSYYKNLNNRLNSEAILRQRNFGYTLTLGAKYNILK